MAKVIKTVTSYSKKKGAFEKGITLLAGVTTEEAVEYVQKNFNITLSVDKPSSQLNEGLLAKHRIRIDGWKNKSR